MGVKSVPVVRIIADGQPLARAVERTLLSVTVMAEVWQPAVCELLFVDPPDGALDIGQALSVGVGGERTALFDGRVVSVEHGWQPNGARVRVRAFDALHGLRRRQSTGDAGSERLSQAITRLADALGLTVEIHADGPALDGRVRVGGDDLARLGHLAHRVGCGFTLVGDAWHVFDGDGFDAPHRLRPGHGLYDVTATRRDDRTGVGVTADAWLPSQGRTVRVERSGSANGEAPPLWLGNRRAGTDAEVDAMADAARARRAAAGQVVEGTVAGDARLVPGHRVELSGLGPHIDGTHVVTRVTHVLDGEQGYRTRWSTAWPKPPTPPGRGVTAPAIVVDVDDPERRARVRVQLPTWGYATTGWLPTVMPGAGAARGVLALPDVGDGVLVLFDEGQPGHGVVIGGLFPDDDAPDVGVAGGRARQVALRGPSGHRVILDDDDEQIDVQHANGDRVRLTPNGIEVQTGGTLVLEGRRVVVRGGRIDFERL